MAKYGWPSVDGYESHSRAGRSGWDESNTGVVGGRGRDQRGLVVSLRTQLRVVLIMARGGASGFRTYDVATAAARLTEVPGMGNELMDLTVVVGAHGVRRGQVGASDPL